MSIQGTGADKVTTVQVWAPAGSWGPHLDVLVTTYQQKGSDKNTRVSLGTGPSAIPQMVTAAGQDFGIKSPSSGTTVSGAPKPDHKLPLIRYGQRVGTIDIWHNGKADWVWKAHANDGEHLASGKAKTLNGVQQNAAVKTLVAGVPGIGLTSDVYPRDLAFFGGVPGVGAWHLRPDVRRRVEASLGDTKTAATKRRREAQLKKAWLDHRTSRQRPRVSGAEGMEPELLDD